VTGRSRVLVLTPRFPYPVVGGDRLRIHAICRMLAREHSLTLLSLCEGREEFDPALVTDGVFDRIERVYLPRWRSLAQVAAALPGRTPLQVAYYRSRPFTKAVARLVPEHDLAFAHLIRTGNYLLGSDRPAMVEMTDAISMNYERVRRQRTRGLRGRVYAAEQARLLAYERRLPAAVSAVSLIAAADARYLWGEHVPDNVVIASNGVDTERLPFFERAGAKRVAVFIGNVHSAQNMDACRHFVSDILPLLSETDLNEFRVVGRIREADAAWLRARSRVTVTGEVPSIPDAVADARIGVCPVRIGAGVQNKVLEYMALGLPTVASPVGHEGIDAVAGEDLLVAPDPAGFAGAIRRLNEDEALFRSLADKGRRFVETRHGWEAALEPIAAAVRDLVTSRRIPTASSAPS
jgi:glycosyltransferase involved in cell wall biosynthesis